MLLASTIALASPRPAAGTVCHAPASKYCHWPLLASVVLPVIATHPSVPVALPPPAMLDWLSSASPYDGCAIWPIVVALGVSSVIVRRVVALSVGRSLTLATVVASVTAFALLL